MSESILISTISQTAMQQKILVDHSSSVITTLKFLSLFPYKQLHKQQCNKRFGYIIHQFLCVFVFSNTQKTKSFITCGYTPHLTQIHGSIPISTTTQTAMQQKKIHKFLSLYLNQQLTATQQKVFG